MVELDDLIDRATKSYAAEEPRQGLEQRIVQRVRAEGRRGSFISWWFAVLAPVFVVVVFLVNGRHGDEKPPVIRRAEFALSVPAAVPVPAPVLVRQAKRVKVLPRALVFPTPRALTEQERALMAFVAFGIPERRDLAPIEIARIDIAPLATSGEQ